MSLIIQITKQVTLDYLREIKDLSEIDLYKFTTELQGRIIVNIAVGPGQASTTIPYENEDGSFTALTVPHCINRVTDSSVKRLMQPHVFLFRSFLTLNVTPLDRLVKRNALRVRAALRKFMEDRRSGKNKSADGDDLLSILLTNDYYKNDDELIIDEIFTLFLAGSKTVATTTANLICYLDKSPNSKSKLLTEVDSSLSSIKDDFMGKFDLEKAEELDYLHMCFFEALRIEAPVNAALDAVFTEEVVLGGIHFKTTDRICVAIDVIHHHPDHWQKPSQFLPERFDPNSELYKRPDGGHRHPMAFTPFLGGQRVCLGKTFAEKMV
jgi:cytochrome P450